MSAKEKSTTVLFQQGKGTNKSATTKVTIKPLNLEREGRKGESVAEKELQKCKDELQTLQKELIKTRNDLQHAEMESKTTQHELQAFELQLDTTQKQLESTQIQLESSQKQLESSQKQLKSSHKQLESSQKQLESSQKQLESSQHELQATRKHLETSQKELQKTKDELESTQEQLETSQKELHSTQMQLQRSENTLRAFQQQPKAKSNQPCLSPEALSILLVHIRKLKCEMEVLKQELLKPQSFREEEVNLLKLAREFRSNIAQPLQAKLEQALKENESIETHATKRVAEIHESKHRMENVIRILEGELEESKLELQLVRSQTQPADTDEDEGEELGFEEALRREMKAMKATYERRIADMTEQRRTLIRKHQQELAALAEDHKKTILHADARIRKLEATLSKYT